MITVPAGLRVLIATKPIDFRKGADGLAALVRETLGDDPFSGSIYVFRSKRADRVKMVAWDGTGLVLLWKRLESRCVQVAANYRRRDATDTGTIGCTCGRNGLVAAACARRYAADGNVVSAAF